MCIFPFYCWILTVEELLNEWQMIDNECKRIKRQKMKEIGEKANIINISVCCVHHGRFVYVCAMCDTTDPSTIYIQLNIIFGARFCLHLFHLSYACVLIGWLGSMRREISLAHFFSLVALHAIYHKEDWHSHTHTCTNTFIQTYTHARLHRTIIIVIVCVWSSYTTGVRDKEREREDSLQTISVDINIV